MQHRAVQPPASPLRQRGGFADCAWHGERRPRTAVHFTSMIPVFCLLAVAAVAAGDAPPAEDAIADARDSVTRAAPAGDSLDLRGHAYEQFREHYDAGRYREALSFAKRVVKLCEIAAECAAELPTAYNNLGATQLQLGDAAAAETSYKRALEFLEGVDTVSSRRPIVPLVGLGLASAARGWHDLAIEYFTRAIATSRRVDGLFNQAQITAIEQLIESYLAIGSHEDALRERSYLLQIAEHNYGLDDLQIIPSLYQLAIFREYIHDFEGARADYARVLAVSEKQGGGRLSPGAIAALVAIGRTYRQQYLLDPESLEPPPPPRDLLTRMPEWQKGGHFSRLPPEIDMRGYRSIQYAIGRLRSVSDPPARLLADALLELGDWAIILRRERQARRNYAEAFELYQDAQDDAIGNPLAKPRLVIYQPPVVSWRNRLAPPQISKLRKTEFTLTVDRHGAARDIKVVTSDMSDSQLTQLRRALERAVYSPRYEGGEPVESRGVSFAGEWYELDLPEGTTPTAY
ncbi:MAG TPA: tetratricopeptide repeat protein [Vicinamibacterales bacterium]|nr:tetratricopeptide repeat protein [Vicinamibacterales bacterium]